MADEEKPPQTSEEKYASPLPKQLRDQMAQVEAMMGPPRDPDETEENGDQTEENGGQTEENGDQEGGERPPPQSEPESWEQRARSTLGRLEQSVQANQAMAKRISDLEREISVLRINGAEPAPPAQQQQKPKPQYVKPEEINDYGEEFFDVVGRKAKEEFVPMAEQFEQRIARLESGQKEVGKVVENTQKRGVYEQLADAVPEWREINFHPAFKEWLSFSDPYSGRQRHEMLQEAFSRHDGNRVVNFFRGFLTEATGLPSNAPSQNGNSAPPLANGNASEKPSLEDFAAPGRARSGLQELPPDKPVYTSAWIAKFSADKRTGKYRGREAEAEAIERDIFQAQHEGRIH